MRFFRFNQFILEKNENDSTFSDVIGDLNDLIEKSLKTSDQKTREDFISAYLRDPEKTQIEGLINDSDIYEFYLKYRNEIDQKLSDMRFYEEKPSDMDSFSLYDYLVKGTKSAIKDFLESSKS
jgi:hypothetical protein